MTINSGMKILFFFFLLLYMRLAYSQSIIFQKIYDGGGGDFGYHVKETTDGGYIVVGKSDSFSSSDDIYLIKTDCNGDTVWTRVLGSPVTSETAMSIQQESDGGYILVGAYLNGGVNDVYLLKTDSDGIIQWTKVYIRANENESGSDVQQTTDGGYIIAGGYSTGSNTDVYLIKCNSVGDTLWTKKFGGPQSDIGNAVWQTTDGGYVVIGTKNFNLTNSDAYLIKTDSNGDSLWTKTYGGTNEERGNSGQQTSDGGYIIAGKTKSFGTSASSVYLVKTDLMGDTLWTKGIYGTATAVAQAFFVQQTTDDGYIITGIHGIAGPNNVYLVKTMANGDTLWTKTFGGSNNDEGWCAQQTTDGGYIVVGHAQSVVTSLTWNIYLIKTDSLGNTSGFPVVGMQEQEQQTTAGEITIYPNPFTAQANLVLPGEIVTTGEAELVIYDVLGNETARVKITAQRALMQRDNLKAGLYFCKVVSNNAIVATGKFIIQ